MSHAMQYVSRAATAVRGAVKEPLKSKLDQQQIFTYKAAKWEGGLTAPKADVTSLSMAGKM
jgi:Mitochondrial ATP synthase epsilon chain